MTPPNALTAEEREDIAIIQARINIIGPTGNERTLLTIIDRLTSASIADSGWQKIESAPKDGTYVLTWCRQWKDDVISNRFLTGPDRWATAFQPTHWQPLPAPPKQGGE